MAKKKIKGRWRRCMEWVVLNAGNVAGKILTWRRTDCSQGLHRKCRDGIFCDASRDGLSGIDRAKEVIYAEHRERQEEVRSNRVTLHLCA